MDTIDLGELVLGLIISGFGIFGLLTYTLEKYVDTKMTLKLQKEIAKLQQKLNVYESNTKILSQDQKAVLSIILKYQTAYYSNDLLETVPKNMTKPFETRFKSFINKNASDNELTVESILKLRLIHAAYDESELLGKKFINASNPVIALNVLMMETAGSEQTVKLVSTYMQEAYTQNLEKLKIKKVQLCLLSLIYKSFVLDFKGINIEDDTYLKYYITDLNEAEIKEAMDELKKVLSIK